MRLLEQTEQITPAMWGNSSCECTMPPEQCQNTPSKGDSPFVPRAVDCFALFGPTRVRHTRTRDPRQSGVGCSLSNPGVSHSISHSRAALHLKPHLAVLRSTVKQRHSGNLTSYLARSQKDRVDIFPTSTSVTLAAARQAPNLCTPGPRSLRRAVPHRGQHVATGC